MPLPLLLPFVGGALLGAGIDAALQVFLPGPRRPFSWGSVAFSAALGLLPGAAFLATSARVAKTSATSARTGQAFGRTLHDLGEATPNVPFLGRTMVAVRTPGSAAERVVLAQHPEAEAALRAAQRAKQANDRAYAASDAAEGAQLALPRLASLPVAGKAAGRVHDSLRGPDRAAPPLEASPVRTRGMTEALAAD